MKAEKQHKVLQAGLIQPKLERSKSGFVDNRPQASSQGIFIKSIQQKENLSHYSMNDVSVHLKSGGNVVQRKVGMEFQTVGGARNVFGANHINGKTDYNGVEAGNPIDTCNGFTITRDSNTDLEYITNPSENKEEVVGWAQAAGDKHKTMKNNPNATVSVRYKNKDYNNCFFYNNATAINRDGEQKAHPQATIGIKLTGIPDLIGCMLTDSIKIGGTKPYYVENQKDSLLVVNVLSKHCINNVTEKCKGLIVLLEQYIHASENMFSSGYKSVSGTEEDYVPKSISTRINTSQINLTKDTMPIMSRTSILYIYKSLSEEDQGNFISYFEGKYDVNNKLVTFSSPRPETPILNKSINVITLKEFIDALKQDHNPMGISKRRTGESSINYSYTSDDISQWDKIDFDGIKDGIAVELRALEREVAPDRWGEVAGAVFDAVDLINSRNTDETT